MSRYGCDQTKSNAALRIAARVRSDLPILGTASGLTCSGDDVLFVSDTMSEPNDSLSVCQVESVSNPHPTLFRRARIGLGQDSSLSQHIDSQRLQCCRAWTFNPVVPGLRRPPPAQPHDASRRDERVALRHPPTLFDPQWLGPQAAPFGVMTRGPWPRHLGGS